MTIAEVQTRLIAAGWHVLDASAGVRTLHDPSSNEMITLAGKDDLRVPDVVLSDIRWTADGML